MIKPGAVEDILLDASLLLFGVEGAFERRRGETDVGAWRGSPSSAEAYGEGAFRPRSFLDEKRTSCGASLEERMRRRERQAKTLVTH